jgi:hypothetical protein
MCDMLLQAARSDTICSLLIFLHLLERNPERVAEFRLAHSEHLPMHPDPAAHVFVHGVGGLFLYCSFHDASPISQTGQSRPTMGAQASWFRPNINSRTTCKA